MKRSMVFIISLYLLIPGSIFANSNNTYSPPVFIQFYDWFWDKSWDEKSFIDPLDWEKVGTSYAERGSVSFYAKQFDYIKNIGISSIAWQYNARRGGTYTIPSKNALTALRNTSLYIAPTYDMEISSKVYEGKKNITATISSSKYIRPDEITTNIICSDMERFYKNVPVDLIAKDKKGNVVIFVFGFGFDDRNPSPESWDEFAARIDNCMSPIVGEKYRFYWSSVNSHFAEHLFLHHANHFSPWHFVVDMPQSQFGHESVTWNFGFDNLSVLKRDGLGRVIKMDPRYVEETAWLAASSDPSLIFIYGWNEPFESSFLFPSKKWGTTKSTLAKYYLDGLQEKAKEQLPPTLLIIDDLDRQWDSRKGDWHLVMLRDMLLYRLRLFAPQSDVITVDNVSAEMLNNYTHIIDLSSKKTQRLVSLLEKNWETHRLMLFDPRATMDGYGYAKHFFKSIHQGPLNRNIKIIPSGKMVFSRGEIYDGRVCNTCKVELWAEGKGERKLPLVISNKNAVFVNSYGNSDEVMRFAFSKYYSRPMGTSILYGEGYASQRLEQSASGVFKKNTLIRHSVNRRWPMPGVVDWYRMPEETPAEHFRFVFGID